MEGSARFALFCSLFTSSSCNRVQSIRIKFQFLHPMQPFCMETRRSSFQPVNKIFSPRSPLNKQSKPLAHTDHIHVYADTRVWKFLRRRNLLFFLTRNASVVSVKVTSHGYYARFTRKRGAGSIDHFRFIVKIVSFESKLLVDRLTCPFVPGTAISNVSSASLSLSLSLLFPSRAWTWSMVWTMVCVGARMKDLDEKES